MSVLANSTPPIDRSGSERIVDEALRVALVTSRVLRAWHSGAVDAQQSMKALWEQYDEIRSPTARLSSARDLTAIDRGVQVPASENHRYGLSEGRLSST